MLIMIRHICHNIALWAKPAFTGNMRARSADLATSLIILRLEPSFEGGFELGSCIVEVVPIAVF